MGPRQLLFPAHKQGKNKKEFKSTLQLGDPTIASRWPKTDLQTCRFCSLQGRNTPIASRQTPAWRKDCPRTSWTGSGCHRGRGTLLHPACSGGCDAGAPPWGWPGDGGCATYQWKNTVSKSVVGREGGGGREGEKG